MLTRHGWAALSMATVAIALGRSLGLLEFYVIGAAAATTVLLAVVGSLRPMPPVETARRCMPPLVTIGEPLRVELTVRNPTTRRVPRLRLWEPVGSRGGAAMQVAPLAAGDSVSAIYRVPTDRRGIQLLGPLRAERSDPLGLSRRTLHLSGTAEAVVTPLVVALPWPTMASGGPLGDRLAARSMGRTGSEFHSQRLYVPGDDPRRINWRASARADTLVIRQTSPEVLSRCTIVLDTHRDSGDGEAFERAVTVAASVLAAADAVGVAARLVAPGVDLRGRAVLDAALRWLAEVDVGDSRLDPTATSSRDDGLELVVAVSAGPRAPLRTAGHDVLVSIVASPTEGPPDPFVIDASTIESFATGWRRLVGPGAP